MFLLTILLFLSWCHSFCFGDFCHFQYIAPWSLVISVGWAKSRSNADVMCPKNHVMIMNIPCFLKLPHSYWCQCINYLLFISYICLGLGTLFKIFRIITLPHTNVRTGRYTHKWYGSSAKFFQQNLWKPLVDGAVARSSFFVRFHPSVQTTAENKPLPCLDS